MSVKVYFDLALKYSSSHTVCTDFDFRCKISQLQSVSSVAVSSHLMQPDPPLHIPPCPSPLPTPKLGSLLIFHAHQPQPHFLSWIFPSTPSPMSQNASSSGLWQHPGQEPSEHRGNKHPTPSSGTVWVANFQSPFALKLSPKLLLILSSSQGNFPSIQFCFQTNVAAWSSSKNIHPVTFYCLKSVGMLSD